MLVRMIELSPSAAPLPEVEGPAGEGSLHDNTVYDHRGSWSFALLQRHLSVLLEEK